MRGRLAVWRNAVVVAAIFAIAFWTLHALPAGGQVATHWGSDQRPDLWIGGAAVQLINPIVALVVLFLLAMAPQGFAARGTPANTVHARFSGFFLAQLAIQLLLAIQARGYTVF